MTKLIRTINYSFIEKFHVKHFMNYKSDLEIIYVSCETKMFCCSNDFFIFKIACTFVSCETLVWKWVM